MKYFIWQCLWYKPSYSQDGSKSCCWPHSPQQFCLCKHSIVPVLTWSTWCSRHFRPWSETFRPASSCSRGNGSSPCGKLSQMLCNLPQSGPSCSGHTVLQRWEVSFRTLHVIAVLLEGLLTVFVALLPILASTSGSLRSIWSPGRPLVGVAGDLGHKGQKN